MVVNVMHLFTSHEKLLTILFYFIILYYVVFYFIYMKVRTQVPCVKMWQCFYPVVTGVVQKLWSNTSFSKMVVNMMHWHTSRVQTTYDIL